MSLLSVKSKDGLKLRRAQGGEARGALVRAAASATLVLLIVGLLQAVTSIGDAVDEKSWHLHHTYEALLWSGMLLCLVLAKPFAAGVPVNRPLAIVGKLSYSFYLVHVPILFCLIYPFKSAAGADAYQQSVGVWLLPLLTYRFLNLKKRIPS